MSYTYLQEQGEESSAACFSDMPRSVLSRLNLTAEKSSCNASGTESFQSSQSGTTCEHSTESLGADLLTLSAEDSRARTCLHSRLFTGTMTDSTESEADSGPKCAESLARYSRRSCLWKTRQCSLFGGLTEFSGTWPRWGMMQDGELLGQTPPASITSANESGLLPTVMASDWKGGTTAIRKDRGDQRLDQWRDYVKVKYGLTYPHPTHSEIRMGWPIGWTDLKPLETGKFQLWRQSHGGL